MSVDKPLSIHKVAVTICEKSLGQVTTSLLHGGFRESEKGSARMAPTSMK